jgi:RNA polymerase sigma-70 factor (ECF subfamily)
MQSDTLSTLADAELARRARTQDGRAAFAALYRRYLVPVYRYFCARTGNIQQAEDLTAQTFVAALEGRSRYRERGSFAGWLFTIAARRLADHHRRRQTVPLNDIADPPDPRPPPETLIERAEQMTYLARAVEALSPDRAQAIALHFFGGLSLKETARVMKRSRVAVKSLIHRALRDLREKLDDER